jgi:hypothetical protein
MEITESLIDERKPKKPPVVLIIFLILVPASIAFTMFYFAFFNPDDRKRMKILGTKGGCYVADG